MDNKIHDVLDTVKASEALKASTKEYLRRSRQARAVRNFRPAIYKTILAVCTMLLLVAGIGGYSYLQTPVSYVSIDVNPSIELALNRFDRVVSATGFNKDGEAVLENLSLKGSTYTEAIDQILESAGMEPYLTEAAELVFTVAASDDEKEDMLLSGIGNCSGNIEHGGHSVSADMDTVTLAHHNGMSLGKYSAYLELSQYDPSVTVEDCHHMSMSQIHGLIREHEKEHDPEHSSGHESGQNSDDSSYESEHDSGHSSEHQQEHDRGHSDQHE